MNVLEGKALLVVGPDSRLTFLPINQTIHCMLTKTVIFSVAAVEAIVALSWLIAQISDAKFTTIFGFLSTVFLGVMAYLMAKLNKGQNAAAVEVVKVKEALISSGAVTAESLVGIAKVTKDTFVLSNSRMGMELKKVADLANTLVKETLPTNPLYEARVQAANAAVANYKEHIEKQAIIDAAVANYKEHIEKQAIIDAAVALEKEKEKEK